MRTAWHEALYTPPPTNKAVHRIGDKLGAQGTVCTVSKSGRSKTSMMEENNILVAMSFVSSPKKSTRRAYLDVFRYVIVPNLTLTSCTSSKTELLHIMRRQ